MAQITLLDTYVFRNSFPDPSNPGYYIDYYARRTATYDTATRAISRPAAVEYSQQSGFGPPPANYSKPATELVDAYVVPTTGPGANTTYTGQFVQAYHDGNGGLTFTPAAGPLALRLRVTAPTAPGSMTATVTGGTAPYSAALVYGQNQTPDANGNTTFAGLAAGSYTLSVTDAAGRAIGQSFTISGAATVGCLLPRALNYNPSATQDSTPTACVFVAVDVAPAPLVAAHLPIPVLVRASPTVLGYAVLVTLILETADMLAGPWTEFGRLQKTCNALAEARFNLSEAAKSLLRIAPPAEAGPDAALSALLRISYQVQEPLLLAITDTGPVGICRVLNATIAPREGGVLTTATPYASQPAAAALWASTATAAGGVTSAALALPADGCTPRQFVWLNAAGAFDQGFFYGRHVHGTDQQDAQTVRDAAGASRYARRGVVRDTLQVYSDRLDFATYLALRGVRSSVQVYERTGPGQYVPVLVTSGSFQEYQEVTDKTWTVDFVVSYPQQLIQTQ